MNAATPHAKGFTSWKLDLLDAMARDPMVQPVDFHVAFVIVQHVNQHSRLAVISDKRLQNLVHRDRKGLMKARKRLAELGWVEIQTGRYGKATEYRFTDDRAKLLENIRLDEPAMAEEVNNGAKPTHCDQNHNEAKTPHSKRSRNGVEMPHYGRPNNGEKTPHCETGAKAPRSNSQWGENGTHSGEEMHPLHLNTRRDSLPLKNKTLEAYEAHVIAFDRWTEFEEIAAHLEFDEQLTRQEAEHQARILCGFDDANAGGRQGAAIAPPTLAGSTPFEGEDNDRHYKYHV
jgi:hypothetical protein